MVVMSRPKLAAMVGNLCIPLRFGGAVRVCLLPCCKKSLLLCFPVGDDRPVELLKLVETL